MQNHSSLPAPSTGPFLLVLFKGYLHKYEYVMTTPQLICFSNKLLSTNVSYELKLIDGSKIQKEMRL